jgi:3-oxo-5-alpha-steroid 4-dehydrogenase 1
VIEKTFFSFLLWGWFALAAVTLPVLLFVTAPYGRHRRSGWGPTVGDKWGWVMMEAPASLGLLGCFVVADVPYTGTMISFLFMWQAHYIYRAFIYPLAVRRDKGRMPIAVVALGMCFNVVNTYLNGRYLYHFSGGYADAWLVDPRFLVGTAVFVAGLLVNLQADHVLRELRRPGESGYQIPHGGLFRWVSCPNYLGEIVEWIGWAIATWSIPGAAFALWTIANLAPRARSHHEWYKRRFPNYPDDRKALVPGIW